MVSSSTDYSNSFIIQTAWPSVTLDGGTTTNRKWSILNGGAGAGVGLGNFGIFDITSSKYRFSINASDNTINLWGHQLLDCTCKQFLNFQGAWGGGVNTTFAYYKNSSNATVHLSGYATGYNSGGGFMSIRIRIYCRNNATYYYSYVNMFTNVTYNHVSYPIDVVFDKYVGIDGWYDVYIDNNSGFITDTNDYVRLTASIFPNTNF